MKNNGSHGSSETQLHETNIIHSSFTFRSFRPKTIIPCSYSQDVTCSTLAASWGHCSNILGSGSDLDANTPLGASTVFHSFSRFWLAKISVGFWLNGSISIPDLPLNFLGIIRFGILWSVHVRMYCNIRFYTAHMQESVWVSKIRAEIGPGSKAVCTIWKMRTK